MTFRMGGMIGLGSHDPRSTATNGRSSVAFPGLRFANPFLRSSAPPTEPVSNIMRAFEAGWGGVDTKTIGLHQVVNGRGPKTKFMRATPESYHLSMEKR